VAPSFPNDSATVTSGPTSGNVGARQQMAALHTVVPLHEATRRSLREERIVGRTKRADTMRSSSAAGAATVRPRGARLKSVINFVVMTFAFGLVATLSLPSYAFDPAANADPRLDYSEAQFLKDTQSQSFNVAAGATASVANRDVISATTLEELNDTKAAAAAAEAAADAGAVRASIAANRSTYAGPSVSEILASPPYPDFSLDQVYSVGLQYQGVPYVYGGSTPAGFDCSGFVMFVYAQFGISLPHSVVSQDAIGTTISAADAQPGDLVIFDDGSHNGIYAGNGNILHAPYSGASVRVQPIWTSAVHYVRLGI
jgi:cell wall-associated NlpC family hydrolase